MHALFVLFVVLGGLLVLWRPKVAWLHLPAVAWGVVIEVGGCICPLTYLENDLRQLGGTHSYGGSFIERYLEPLLYPIGLTHKSHTCLRWRPWPSMPPSIPCAGVDIATPMIKISFHP